MNGFRWNRVRSIALKETRHIRRDPFTLSMAIGVPVLMVTFFGYLIDFDVKEIGLLLVDRDQSQQSRVVSGVFASSEYFVVKPRMDAGNPFGWLDAEKGKAVAIIERGFAKEWGRQARGRIQVAIDGSDNQTAGVVRGYLEGIGAAATARLSGRPPPLPMTIETRFLFNPELNSRWFTVPGLVVIVIGILSILLTALTIAREWENGSMELLLSTPVHPSEIIVGKLLPYVVLGLGSVAVVYIAARVLFGVPFQGSHVLFAVATAMFLGTTLAQGIVISVITRQQQLAMQMANISGMLPAIMLSGFVFPIESMSPFFQTVTAALAPRWFMEICRGIFLKGAGVGDLAKPLIALAIINAVLIRIAVRRFKRDLEP
jgi:ABC-2 type transport system permease protein